MNHPTLRKLIERQLEVASLSGEVIGVMHGIVERLLELRLADGASISTCADGIAHFDVALGADEPLQGLTYPLDDTLGADQTYQQRFLAGEFSLEHATKLNSAGTWPVWETASTRLYTVTSTGSGSFRFAAPLRKKKVAT